MILYHGSMDKNLNKLSKGCYLSKDPSFSAHFGPYIYKVIISRSDVIKDQGSDNYISKKSIEIKLMANKWIFKYANNSDAIDEWKSEGYYDK